MNRFFTAAVVALFVVGATGCATGVDDPQPAQKQPTPSHAPVAQPFAADLPEAMNPPDPNQIGTGLEAPKPDLSFDKPIPTNGIDPNEVETSDIDPNVEIQVPIPVNL